MADPDVIRYFRIAQADLIEARRMVEPSGFRDSSIGFLLQQACEKASKSWIHSKGGLGSLHTRPRAVRSTTWRQ
jgi:hypothetical protein